MSLKDLLANPELDMKAMADDELPKRPITPPVTLPRPITPTRTIERLGLHHGSGQYRVSVGDQHFTGSTELEAVASAVCSLLHDHGTVTINVVPPLPV